jgi:DNA primase
MSIDLDHIRSRNPIEDVVAEKFNLKKSGSRFIGVEHDSLVVVPQSGMYFWVRREAF